MNERGIVGCPTGVIQKSALNPETGSEIVILEITARNGNGVDLALKELASQTQKTERRSQ